MGCHFLLQEIFLTQGSNPHPLHWQMGSLSLSHQGSPHFAFLPENILFILKYHILTIFLLSRFLYNKSVYILLLQLRILLVIRTNIFLENVHSVCMSVSSLQLILNVKTASSHYVKWRIYFLYLDITNYIFNLKSLFSTNIL